MKEYPVGSVCVIVTAHPDRQYVIGRECTIVGAIGSVPPYPDQYSIRVQGEGEALWAAPHKHLKLKRPPKDEKFEEFMQSVLKPVGLPAEDLV